MAAALTIFLLGTQLAAGAPAAVPPTYDATLTNSYRLERAGRNADAARSLEWLATRYPQDYALALRLGWLWFQAGNYPLAVRSYRRAISLSSGAPAAHLGLGWSLLRQNRSEDAAGAFRAALSTSPGLASARRGLELSEARFASGVSPLVSLLWQRFSGHPARTWGLTTSLAMPALLWGRLYLAGTYRFSHYRVVDTTGTGNGAGPGAGRTSETGFQQHEAHLALGLVGTRGGLTGHYSYLTDGSGWFDRAHVAGVATRWSPWGDVTIEASVSDYPDVAIYRVAASWSLPVFGGWRLVPGFAVQRVSGETLGLGSLALAWSNESVAVWAGGKAGEESRPALLTLATVYSIPERIRFGGWAGFSVHLGSGWRLSGAYELLSLQLDMDPGGTAYVHYLSLGLGWGPTPG